VDSAASSRVAPCGVVGLLGLTVDENSSVLRGAALAPPRVREALNSGSANLCTENGSDLASEERLTDLGDLELSTGIPGFSQIEDAVAKLLQNDGRLLALGGDHSITYPIVRAYSRAFSPLCIIHLDAHPDLHDESEGSRLSHACPLSRIM
jgi:arginase